MMLSNRAASLKRLGMAAVAAGGLFAVVLSAAPAEAQVIVTGPVVRPVYVPPPYAYPVPRVVYRRCGFGWHFTPAHWNRFGRWVPAHCSPNW